VRKPLRIEHGCPHQESGREKQCLHQHVDGRAFERRIEQRAEVDAPDDRKRCEQRERRRDHAKWPRQKRDAEEDQRRPIFGYTGMVSSAFAIAGLSMGVWAHHMFTTGAVNDPFFSFVSFLIAVPTGIKFFNWIATMWGGSIRYTTAMWYALGFLMNFLLGGVTGVMVASPPVDFQARDSYFLVAHFHYTLGGGSFFALFAALFYMVAQGLRLVSRRAARQDRFRADVLRVQHDVLADVFHGHLRHVAPRFHVS
jgi:hypothetical protein